MFPPGEFMKLPAHERGVVWRRCSRRAMHHWQPWAALAGSMLLALVPAVLVLFVPGGGPTALWIVLLMIAPAVAPLVVFIPVLYRYARPYIETELGRRCSRCDYDLRGLPDATTECPECGTPRP
jgi:hypothetical protein